MLGICNGFQILCEAGLLPGVLRPNASLAFVLPRRSCPRRARRHRRSRPAASRAAARHSGQARRGLLYAPADLDELERGQVVLRYARDENPNGSRRATSRESSTPDGNVLGLMPHPEHAVDPLLGSGDGALVLASLVDAARERLYARA